MIKTSSNSGGGGGGLDLRRKLKFKNHFVLNGFLLVMYCFWFLSNWTFQDPADISSSNSILINSSGSLPIWSASSSSSSGSRSSTASASPSHSKLLLQSNPPPTQPSASSSFMPPPLSTIATATTDKKVSTSAYTKKEAAQKHSIQSLYNQTNKVVRKPSKKVTVLKHDSIFSSKGWDMAPIVVEDYKLIFFTIQKVGCTVWKQLFRRMKGYEDWNRPLGTSNPKTNGLTYLYHYNRSYATKLMNDPTYTRAMFVRDPKEKFLSAYLDKAQNPKNRWFFHKACCGSLNPRKAPRSKYNRKVERCMRRGTSSFEGFVELTRTCQNPHWAKQSQRMESKYWKTLNFIGHLETAQADAYQLLQQINAWDDYGKTGWGLYRNESIFASNHHLPHATSQGIQDSKARLALYYTPELETEIDRRYADDYETPILGLNRKDIEFE